MKTKYVLGFALCLSLFSGVTAQGIDGFGVGVIVGEPTGLSFKNWLADGRAIDAGLAWSFSENESLHLHADYLFHNFDALRARDLKGSMAVYYGIGARIKLKESNQGRGRNDNDTLMGIRVPFGITYLLPDAPVDLFAEIVPVLDVVPDSKMSLNAAIGVRYYF